MKSNYKKLGKFIRPVNIRNAELRHTTLLGVNIDKFFMPSVANIVGTDMAAYKIVKNRQFACNRMHVGRDYRLPVAISKTSENFLVSPAYDVFEVNNPEELLPEYLMMWLSRKEFDRNAWFYTDADVRGGLNWKAFCEMELPVPNINKQREIVKEYNILINRIELNNIIIKKLEETAQAIYKQWFVDFEFFDRNGKSYKSSGGDMAFNEELEKNIPMGWEVISLKDKVELISRGPSLKYIDGSGIPVINQKCIRDGEIALTDIQFSETVKNKEFMLRKNDTLINSMGDGTLGRVSRNLTIEYDMIVHNCITIVRAGSNYSPYFIYYFVKQHEKHFVNTGSGSTGQTSLRLNEIEDLRIICPKTNEVLVEFDKLISTIWNNIAIYIKQNYVLDAMKKLLLSKLAINKN